MVPKRKTTRRRTGPRALRAAERQSRALKLRAAGKTLDEVAQACGYASRASAFEAIRGALAANQAEGVDRLRVVQGARLEELLGAVWSKALRGDCEAVRTAARIIEGLRRLYGTDLPSQTEITVRGEALPDDVEALKSRLLVILRQGADPAAEPEAGQTEAAEVAHGPQA